MYLTTSNAMQTRAAVQRITAALSGLATTASLPVRAAGIVAGKRWDSNVRRIHRHQANTTANARPLLSTAITPQQTIRIRQSTSPASKASL